MEKYKIYLWIVLISLGFAYSNQSLSAQSGTDLIIVPVSAPNINCIFDTDCSITVQDSTDSINIPFTTGTGFLQSRTFPIGEFGTPAAGLYGYEYRIDLRNLTSTEDFNCISEFSLPAGPIVPITYANLGYPNDLFFVSQGGLGNIAPQRAVQDEDTITFTFKPSVCIGDGSRDGDSTFFFGFASTAPPTSVSATLSGNAGYSETLSVRAPQGQNIERLTIETELDTTLNENVNANTPSPVAHHLRVGEALFSDNKQSAIMQFDLTDIPVNATIKYAQLNLWHEANISSISAARDVCVKRINEPWAEKVSAATAPEIDFICQASTPIADGHGVQHWGDLGALIESWRAGIFPNHGIALQIDNASGVKVFHSLEQNVSPELIIYYEFDQVVNPPVDRSKSMVEFDSRAYELDDECFNISVTDLDQNNNAELVESVLVSVVDTYPVETATKDLEELALQETGPSTGIFKSQECIPLVIGGSIHNDGKLQTREGNIISAVYQDEDNPATADDADDLVANFDFSSDKALIKGGKPTGVVSIEIDESILPAEMAFTMGATANEAPRPIAAVVGPTGAPVFFGEDQIVMPIGIDEDVTGFASAINGDVVEDFVISGENEDARYVIIRFDPLATSVSTNDLSYLIEQFDGKGKYTFSSEAGASLLANILQQQLTGRFVMHNPVMWALGDPEVEEAFGANGFGQKWYGEDPTNLREAILHMDITDVDRARSVNVAFVDGGFASPNDYQPGDIHEGLDNPDYGVPFDEIVQGDCVGDCSGSASGEFPIGGFCAGGASLGCSWHGTLAFAVAGAVGDNNAGAMGVAGLARNEAGETGESGLMEPMFFKVGLPYMTNAAKAINASTDAGAEIINVSGGFACEPIADIDICKRSTRTAIHISCPIVNSFVSFLIPPPLSNILTTSVCGGFYALFELTGVASENALEAAVNNAFVNDVLVVASGPENVTVAGIELGPFDAQDDEFYPCAYPTATCVGSINSDHEPSEFNPMAPGIDVWAPGEGLWATAIPGSITRTLQFTGTSAAAPYITGVATMLKTIDSDLTPSEIENILKTTSVPLTSPGIGTCATRPGSTDCVGFVDVLAAVQSASDITLACTIWGEIGEPNDSFGSALYLGSWDLPPGSGASSLLSPNKGVHALSYDTDFYKIEIGPRLPDSIHIALFEQADLGDLAFRVYGEMGDGAPFLITRSDINGPDGFTLNTPFQGALYVEVFALGETHISDNCYDEGILVIEAVRAAEKDRFEENDSKSAASSLENGWNHEARCPRNPTGDCTDVFEDGAVSTGLVKEWSQTFTDLTIHSLTDQDFWQISLPDPGLAADAGIPDIRPEEVQTLDPANPIPLPECGTTTRNHPIDLIDDSVTMRGRLEIKVIPTGNALSQQAHNMAGEAIHLYDSAGANIDDLDTGSELHRIIHCPRSVHEITELIASFGERLEERTDLSDTGGFTLDLKYIIDVSRRPINDGPEFSEPLPCGPPTLETGSILDPPNLSGTFPICGEDGGFPGTPPDGPIDVGAQHPLTPFDPCLADGPGCFGFIDVYWPFTQDILDLTFTAPESLLFELINSEGESIASATNGVPVPRFNQRSAAMDEKRLMVDQLPAGLYFLKVSGPPAEYTITYTPPTVPEVSIPAGGAQPTISLSSDSAKPGDMLTLNGSGFGSGGFEGVVQIDGLPVAFVSIPLGGNFSDTITLPETLSLTNHTVSVCAGRPCFSGNLEMTAETQVNLTDRPIIKIYLPVVRK